MYAEAHSQAIISQIDANRLRWRTAILDYAVTGQHHLNTHPLLHTVHIDEFGNLTACIGTDDIWIKPDMYTYFDKEELRHHRYSRKDRRQMMKVKGLTYRTWTLDQTTGNFVQYDYDSTEIPLRLPDPYLGYREGPDPHEDKEKPHNRTYSIELDPTELGLTPDKINPRLKLDATAARRAWNRWFVLQELSKKAELDPPYDTNIHISGQEKPQQVLIIPRSKFIKKCDRKGGESSVRYITLKYIDPEGHEIEVPAIQKIPNSIYTLRELRNDVDRFTGGGSITPSKQYAKWQQIQTTGTPTYEWLGYDVEDTFLVAPDLTESGKRRLYDPVTHRGMPPDFVMNNRTYIALSIMAGYYSLFQAGFMCTYEDAFMVIEPESDKDKPQVVAVDLGQGLINISDMKSEVDFDYYLHHMQQLLVKSMIISQLEFDSLIQDILSPVRK